jgi:SAM-dependent methyltransferase
MIILAKNWLPELRCPHCLGALNQEAGQAKCATCGREFSTQQGISCQERSAQDAGEIGPQQMRELLKDCTRMPWQAALERAAQKLPRASVFLERAVSPCLASWWLLLDLQASWRVLDLGCEWGANSFALVPYVEAVVACDRNPDRLRFMDIRAEQDRVSNLQTICLSDTPYLPFADRQFDLVIFGGGRGSIPAQGSGPPAVLQRDFLREVARILKPDGHLLLAVRNRWSLRAWRGEPDENTGLRFVSLLPRPIADFYAKKRTGKHYRDLTYSLQGYRRLLNSAGFASSKSYLPLPDWRSYHALIDSEDRQAVETYFAERGSGRWEAIELKFRSGLAEILASSFFCVGNRGEARAPVLEEIGAQVIRDLAQGGNRATSVKFRVTRREVVTCELGVGEQPAHVILKIPLSAAANARTNLEHETLLSLRSHLQASGKWPEIPKALVRGEFRNIPYYVQEAMPGYSGLRFSHSSDQQGKWMQQALDFIFRLHLATQTSVKLDEAVWNEAVMPLLAPALRMAEQSAGVNSTYLRDLLMQELAGRSWPFVFNHGDYWLGNLLFDPTTGRLQGVIDWDRALPSSLPLIDLFNVLLSARAEMASTSVICLLIQGMRTAALDPADQKVTAKYCERLGFELSPSQLRAFLLIDWLTRVSTRVSSRQATWWCEQDWLRDNVIPSAKWLPEIFGPECLLTTSQSK